MHAGDDRKVQLEPGVDNTFSLDLKQLLLGMVNLEGLDAGPIEVDLHGSIHIVADATEAAAWPVYETGFLSSRPGADERYNE